MQGFDVHLQPVVVDLHVKQERVEHSTRHAECIKLMREQLFDNHVLAAVFHELQPVGAVLAWVTEQPIARNAEFLDESAAVFVLLLGLITEQCSRGILQPSRDGTTAAHGGSATKLLRPDKEPMLCPFEVGDRQLKLRIVRVDHAVRFLHEGHDLPCAWLGLYHEEPIVHLKPRVDPHGGTFVTNGQSCTHDLCALVLCVAVSSNVTNVGNTAGLIVDMNGVFGHV